MRQDKEVKALVLRLGLKLNLVCCNTPCRVNLLGKLPVLL